MSKILNFESNQYRETDVPVDKLRFNDGDGGYDGRKDAAADPHAENEIVKQGGPPRLPQFTEDLVAEDGRHGAGALILMGTENGVAPKTIRVLVHKGVWFDRLDADEKAQLKAYSNRSNLGVHGFTTPATEADIQDTMESNIKNANWTLARFREFYKGRLPVGRITRIFGNAAKAVEASRIRNGRIHLKKHPKLSPIEVAKLMGLPIEKAPSLVQKPDPPISKRSFKAMKDRQDAMDKAVISVVRYANSNLRAVEDGEMSGKMALDLADYQIRTAYRALEKAQASRDTTAKKIEAREKESHRY
jgi:hypothetical protein